MIINTWNKGKGKAVFIVECQIIHVDGVMGKKSHHLTIFTVSVEDNQWMLK